MKRLIITAFTVSCLLCVPSHAADAPKRIVSLAPSMTELLFAFGLEERIVGVTNFCDYPEGAKKKPKIGGMSNPSLEAVITLKPDLVVMTVDGNPREFEERLRSLKIKTYVFRRMRLLEFPQGIREAGAALGVGEKADAIAGGIEKTLEKFRTAKRPVHKKKILFIVWPEPLIVAGRGSIADDVISILGEENIAGDSKTPYPKYSIEE
ncbi:MAG TPA: helical backbone metal receptor, partial [Thermodesulfovibrionales bacterium]|nr:helical backbone metal receptor [Thermodesulfovibrionales bacterium]